MMRQTARQRAASCVLLAAALHGCGKQDGVVSGVKAGSAVPTALPSVTTLPNQNAPMGYLDMISADGRASGWALDSDSFPRSLEVRLFVGGPLGTAEGRLIGTVRASYPRTDLNKFGYPGDHGYSFRIPDRYWDGKPHKLYAYAVDLSGDREVELKQSPLPFTLRK